ncbi:MAG TPA: DMT family transporter, partial [Epulopiscium sp.]|nr:DMT family transporter [Candidatus Epulonipiscium sp.]
IVVNVLGAEGEIFSIGVLYGLIAALFYAALMITNKFVRGISAMESTWVPLIVAAILMSAYVFFTTGEIVHLPKGNDIWLVLIVGVVHTGIAYHLYFSAMQKLSGQSISVLSYIDPGSALLFALVFLGERLSVYQLIGALLIFGGTINSQIVKKA